MTHGLRSRECAFLLLATCALWACEEPEPPEFTFYDDRIAPVIEVGCVQQTTGCHLASPEQTAVGNLDLSSYDALMRREDVLVASGPYSVGQLLLKGGDPIQVPVQTFDSPDPAAPEQRFVAITTDVRHGGGALLRLGSDGYAALKSWIAQGHRRDGAVREELNVSQGACHDGPGQHAGFDPNAPVDTAAFDRFVIEVQPVLVERCAGGSCHGSPIADLYLSCGNTLAEQRWNYFVSLAHLDPSVSLSEILRRPLSKQRGGTFHEGGTIFEDTEDPGYETLRSWAEDVVERAPEAVDYQPEDPGLRFFGNYVQPMLVKKGCMFGNCHSPSMFHDLRLRGGSQGTFSRIAIDRNYEMARLQLALESADPNDSRIIAKNLFVPERGGHGIAHRGGALFEDFGTPATAEQCEGIDVAATPLDEVPAYCVMVAWHRLERLRDTLSGGASEERALIWVSRPTGVGDPRDFDTYRPGADLVRAELTLDASGRPALGPNTSLLGGCGLDPQTADVRGPAVSWDGTQLAFAARSSADAPLRIYQAGSDGSDCAQVPGLAAPEPSANGLFTHDLDPAFAPDGRLVFASTRGNLQGEGYAYQGPQRTPSQLAPNANLYVFDPADGGIRQLTFLLNQELQPSFMADGRLIFTTEKRAPEFFQLAGRRLNLDGGDYHPLFAQRGSVGFELATEIAELPNRNLVMVAAPFGAQEGAGTIVIVNRSIGPDQDDRDPNDRYYQHSSAYPFPGAFSGAAGAFRSPTPLPSGWLVVSCDSAAGDLTRGSFDFDLCALDPRTGAIEHLYGEAGRAEIEAVAVYVRTNYGVFTSRIDEANAHTRVEQGASDAEVHIADLPLLGTLMFANTRTGRPIDNRVGGVDLLESLPPPVDASDFGSLDPGSVTQDAFGSVFTSYAELGHADLNEDGSTAVRFAGGHPILMRLTDGMGQGLAFEEGGPFSGEMIQREEMQFYPGERSNQSFPRRLFNGMCAGCHGSITGYELDIAVDIDVLTSASLTAARAVPPHDFLE